MDMYDSKRLAAGAHLAKVSISQPDRKHLDLGTVREDYWFEPTVTTENGSLKIEGRDGTILVMAPGSWSSVEVHR